MIHGKKKSLLVAPYLGEFGWELMNWQARVRRLALAGTHDRVIICAPPDRRPLYADLPQHRNVIFCPIGRMQLPGEASEDHRIDAAGRPIDADQLRSLAVGAAMESASRLGLAEPDMDILCSSHRSQLWSVHSGEQQFAELRVHEKLTTDVLLIPRTRRLAADRNASADWWNELADRLRNRRLRVDVYSQPISRAIAQLSASRLAAGASTGGLHLASLCRCPHYVWGSGAEIRWTRLGISNRQRYETLWNPFGTPCIYDESGWQPSIEHAEQGILRALDEIGLNCSVSRPAWSLRPKWRIKRRLARLIEAVDGRTLWPWRLRQIVRERLV